MGFSEEKGANKYMCIKDLQVMHEQTKNKH